MFLLKYGMCNRVLISKKGCLYMSQRCVKQNCMKKN